MNHIFNISDIRNIENELFENHIQAYDLMKKAGKTAYKMIKSRYPSHKELLIFCGKGNNAGDAYIIAKEALKDNYKTTIIELYEEFSPLATKARNELKTLKNCPELSFKQYNQQDKLKINENCLIIDAIFGIGFKGEVKNLELSAIQLINSLSHNKIIAIDIPSGLNGNDGIVGGIAVKANLTISFIAAKFGLFLAEGKDYIGHLEIAKLETPESIFAKFNNNFQLLNFDALKELIPQRKAGDNKGNHGHALLIGGFDDMPGAIILAAKTTYRMGAGKVTIMTQRKNYPIIIEALPEAMLADAENKEIKDDFTNFTEKFDSITIGPGLGKSNLAQEILQKILKLEKLKLIDADGLNLIAQFHSKEKLNNTILTPHIKEAARLLDTTTEEILKNREKAIKELCHKYNSTTILKSECSFIKSPTESTIFLSPYGNKALAKAGSGDVLTGIISGLLAQKLSNINAAKLATAIHGKIADIFVKKHNYSSLLISDLIDELKNLHI